MFESLFLNAAALTVGGAMVSSPILIHLINRVRFKRLRWAAMEFLLKSQKRNRRRLIIEQLLLLLLRCLLVLLTMMLLARFIYFKSESEAVKAFLLFGLPFILLSASLIFALVGRYFWALGTGVGLFIYLAVVLWLYYGLGWGQPRAGATGFERRANLHMIVLDDTLSMRDRGKDKDDCFKTGKREIFETIAKSISQSSTDDGIVILRPGDVLRGPNYIPKIFNRLNDPGNVKALETELGKMEVTALHVPLTASLQKIKEKADASQEKITVHVISDFRRTDWTGPEAKDLHTVMADLAKHPNVKKIYLFDTVHPTREPEQGGAPNSNDNLGILEVRPSTRVASVGSTIFITATLVNYSPRDAEVKVVPYNDVDGREISEKNYETPMPVKVPAGKTAQATFSFPVRAELKDDRKGFVRVGVRLLDAAGLPLKNDGLVEDNDRHTVIEVRDKIPVLIIDDSRDETRSPGGDSFYIMTALKSVADSKYEVEFGDKVVKAADARAALESPELGDYTSILMINVAKLLNNEQRDNLERFAKEGGGVCFFMGPDVQAKYYNEELYRQGFGLFPVPIADTFFPMAGEKLKPPEYTKRYQIELRDDLFLKTEKLPIFGAIFNKNEQQREWLKHLPVQRYWPALPRNQWGGEPGQVREVVNLPNEESVANYAAEVEEFAKKLPIENEQYIDWRNGLKRHDKKLREAVGQGAKYPAYKLVELIDKMLQDRSKENDRFSMVEFWDLGDKLVQDLKQDAINLRKRLKYSHPLVIVKDYGRGRVVGWMTTAGKEWNNWAGGSIGSPIYAPLIYELQNYLTSQSGDSGQVVGMPLTLSVDAKRFASDKNLKIVRTYYQPNADKPEAALPPTVHQAVLEKGRWVFKFDQSLQPGFYHSRLMYGDASEAEPARVSWGHAFNVDTRKEGNLQRASQEDLDSSFMRQAGDRVEWRRKGDTGEPLVNKPWDLSEWPYFFLFFIAVLVGEQALAVHLSFHLRNSEAELPAQVAKAQARAA